MSSGSPSRKSGMPSRDASNRKTSSPSLSGKVNKPNNTPKGAGQLRIVGGAWRRRVLPIPAMEGLRPTPDRVRETLFNWLGQSLDGLAVMDVFAGTGALGLEAASRGAAAVTLIEKHPALARRLQEHIQALQGSAPLPVKVSVANADALVWLKRAVDVSFDVIFLDPPFRSDLLKHTLPLALPLLAPQGVLYVEWHEPLTGVNNTQWSDWLCDIGLEVFRADKAGQVHYHLLRRA